MNPTTKSPEIKRGWLRALLILLPFLIISGIFEFLGMVINETVTEPFTNQAFLSQNKMLVRQFCGTIGTLLVVWIFIRYINRENFVDIGFSIKKRSKDIFYGLIAGIVMMGLGTLLLWSNGNLTIDSVNLGFLSLLQSFFLFIIVAVNEEVIVRGYILPNLMDSMNRYIALLLSSFIFTVLHLLNPNVSFIGVSNIFLAGILLGIGYIFTKNLWFAIALHFSWNFFQGPIFGFEVSGTKSETLISQTINGNELLTGGQFGFEGSIIATVLCSVGIIVFWMVYKNQDIVVTA